MDSGQPLANALLACSLVEVGYAVRLVLLSGGISHLHFPGKRGDQTGRKSQKFCHRTRSASNSRL